MKQLSTTVFIVLLSVLGMAQVNDNAIGLRLGGNGDVNGAEISYQMGLSAENRLEFDLGFGTGNGHSRMYLAGIYHWDWNITDALNWYVGPGASVGFYEYDNSKDGINVAVGGQIGIEYDFQDKGAPILLSLDGRPMWDLLGDNSGLGWGAALGVRYIWGGKK
ncbi:MAG: hypothetical protein RLP15_12545 [Cryomorphaceae bacterium]